MKETFRVSGEIYAKDTVQGDEMNRPFPHFPKDNAICPICKTNEDKPCVLLPIDDTEEGNICQAIPTHVECLRDGFRYSPKVGIIYRVVDNDIPAKGGGR